MYVYVTESNTDDLVFAFTSLILNTAGMLVCVNFFSFTTAVI